MSAQTPQLHSSKLSVTALTLPQPAWAGDDQSFCLPQWFLTAYRHFMQLEMNQATSIVTDRLVRARGECVAEEELLARIMLAKMFPLSVGPAALEPSRALFDAVSDAALRALFHVFEAQCLSIAMAAAADVRAALESAVREAQAANNAFVDTTVADAVGNFNALHRHWPEAEAAFAFAYRQATPTLSAEHCACLKALNFADCALRSGDVERAWEMWEPYRESAQVFGLRAAGFAASLGFRLRHAEVEADTGELGEYVLRQASAEGLAQSFDSADVAVPILDVASAERLVEFVRLDPGSGLVLEDAVKAQYCAAVDAGQDLPMVFVSSEGDIQHTEADELLGEDAIWAHMCARLMEATDSVALLGRIDILRFALYPLHEEGFSSFLDFVVQRLSEPIDLPNGQFTLSPRIVVVRPEVGESGIDVWSRGLQALDEWHDEAGSVTFADREDWEAHKRRYQLRQALGGGGIDRELRLEYQPIVDVAKDRIVACEALVHWESPVLGPVTLKELFATHEQTHQLLPLGRLFLSQAIEAAAWFARQDPHFVTAVNISAVELNQDDFAAFILGRCAAAGLATRNLRLEITESAFFQLNSQIGTPVQHLQAAGVRLSLDDFGTGYSNLSTLMSLRHVDLKIARAFVAEVDRDSTSATLCSLVIHAAKLLDVAVVAEHVQTPEQATWLAEHGCSLHQGPLYSPSVSARQLNNLLQAQGVRS